MTSQSKQVPRDGWVPSHQHLCSLHPPHREDSLGRKALDRCERKESTIEYLVESSGRDDLCIEWSDLGGNSNACQHGSPCRMVAQSIGRHIGLCSFTVRGHSVYSPVQHTGY